MRPEEFGEWIKKQRTKRKLSQQEFSSLFNPIVTRQAISAWENGIRLPNGKTIKSLEKITNTHIAFNVEITQIGGKSK